ncbi:LysR family transcriptional regulator [Alteromonas sp. 1_MG-2023]|uniref:LysR substrate-binding domain-containing protein n=1 Tax=Alteromonas sp. 1_MG-2023 TaxID=3062669 RepID=UPI0026E28709|nr:LysR family transcriptional regulator [Alteromonas sp. 1_MG-2023]MDO6566425.1 LysR family transcriptional regulator [Alteromonas sp. 1_MG-2023]
MNFKHLKTFVEVAQCGNFSVAATRLHTVQSAISRHINALEQDLGVTLLSRTTRHVALTPAGDAFLIHARSIIQHCEQAKYEAQQVESGKQGILRIGYLSSACAHFLPQMLRRFAEASPQVDVQIFEMTAGQQLTAFSGGLLDIGFSRPVEGGYEGLIEHLHLSNDPIYLVVSNLHPLADSKDIDLNSLSPYPLTLFARNQAPSLFDAIISAFHQNQIQPMVASEPSSMQALLTQVASSNSVGLVPGCIKNLQTQGCRFIPLSLPLHVSLEMHWQAKPSATAQTWLNWYQEQPRITEKAAVEP